MNYTEHAANGAGTTDSMMTIEESKTPFCGVPTVPKHDGLRPELSAMLTSIASCLGFQAVTGATKWRFAHAASCVGSFKTLGRMSESRYQGACIVGSVGRKSQSAQRDGATSNSLRILSGSTIRRGGKATDGSAEDNRDASLYH